MYKAAIFIALTLGVSAVQAQTVKADRQTIEKAIREIGDEQVRTPDKRAHEITCMLAASNLQPALEVRLRNELASSLPNPNFAHAADFSTYCAYYMLNYYKKGDPVRAPYERLIDRLISTLLERTNNAMKGNAQ